MARSHGKLHADIWRDDDWRHLSTQAQRLYMLLLSQPKLTLCGTLDIAVDRWARMASDSSPESIQAALLELVVHDYVLVDDDACELAIRTFAKHDLDTARMNKNLAKGMWRAWAGLESMFLRHAVVVGLPDDLWEKVREHAPWEATDMRDRPLHRPDVATPRSNERFEPPVQTSGSGVEKVQVRT